MLFQYKAKIRTGEIIEGTINAPNENVAVDVLHGKDYVIVSIHPVEKGGLNLDIGKYLQRPKNKDIVAFTRQLSVLIDADVPLNESLRTLAAQEEKTSFKKVITDVSEAIEGGSSLSIALSLPSAILRLLYYARPVGRGVRPSSPVASLLSQLS